MKCQKEAKKQHVFNTVFSPNFFDYQSFFVSYIIIIIFIYIHHHLNK